jgi:hypothetical protein
MKPLTNANHAPLPSDTHAHQLHRPAHTQYSLYTTTTAAESSDKRGARQHRHSCSSNRLDTLTEPTLVAASRCTKNGPPSPHSSRLESTHGYVYYGTRRPCHTRYVTGRGSSVTLVICCTKPRLAETVNQW